MFTGMVRGIVPQQLRWTLLAALVCACGAVKQIADAPSGQLDAHVDSMSSGSDAMPQPPPTFTAMTPDWGSTAGGTNVKITGTGFTATNVAVSFGVNQGTVTVISDTEIRVVTPAGPHAKVAIKITSDGGSVDVPMQWRYLAPLYAGEGRGGFLGSLYTVDPVTGTSTAVGPIGFGVTGLAISPAGILFGCTTTPSGMQHLITIDPYTGSATDVGRLLNGTTQSGSTDLAFIGSRLVGWRTNLLDINVGNGAVTVGGASGITGGVGNGLAADAAGNLFLAPAKANGNLYRVDTTTGAAGMAKLMTGPTDSLNALTFVGATMYANGGTGTGPTATETLYTIVPGTGAVTRVGPMPIETDALAGIPTQPPLAFAPTGDPAPIEREPTSAYVAAPSPPPETVSIAGVSRLTSDVTVLGADEDFGGISHRVVHLRALASLAHGAKTVVFADTSGATRTAVLGDPSIALVPNQRGALKLIDTRVGFKKIFGPVASMRFVP